MEKNLERLIGISKENNRIYKPIFYRLTKEQDSRALEKLLQNPGINVFDELHGQVRELVKSLHPKHKFQKEELDKAAKEYLADTPHNAYGVWIYYPWLNKLVHALDEEEYKLVRTNRNQYKISPAEREILETKKIGVLGLSVGQSVAIALSMERTYGELRIADFDELELSNLNRIRSGLQDLGLLKTVSTARQIAEIDPFLKVKCFHEGITEENIESFFLDGGKLGMVLDECDGLDIKIRIRQKAKELQVPVIMETSDRGMLDVERFDLNPKLPILHGLIDHLEQDPSKLKGLSNEEKVPYILPMVGLDTMSDRLKASMLEVEQSITTWPQLASDVFLGGAVAANTCRRIMLDKFHVSGRFFVDLNKTISQENIYDFSKERNENPILKAEKVPTVFKGLHPNAQQIELSKEQVEELVNAAILAPSGGNSQPWQFVSNQKDIYLLLDQTKGFSFLDQDRTGARVGLGAAAENLILKAHQMHLQVEMLCFPAGEANNPIAVFRFYNKADKVKAVLETHDFDFLAKEIGTRFTSRLIRDRKSIAPKLLAVASTYAESIDGAKSKWLSQEAHINKIAELAGRIDRITLTNKKGHHDFINEIRWSKEEAEIKRDGIELASVDISAGEAAGFTIAKKWSVIETLNSWNGGAVFEKLSRKSIEKASAVGLISMDNSKMLDFFNAGRSLERLWLYTNSQQLSLHPMTAITFMLYQLENNKLGDLSPAALKDLQSIKEDFYTLFDLEDGACPVMLFRVFIAEEPEMKSLRRTIDDVLIYKSTKEFTS